MSVQFCSLGFKPAAETDWQTIPPGPGYTLLRFPYGAQENEDAWDMHSRAHGKKLVTYADPESGLIVPASVGLGVLELNIIWADGDYTELHDTFVRDPLGQKPDPTAYNHRPRTAGENCFVGLHYLLVRPSTPLGVQVAHNSPTPARVRMAQFKLAIHTIARPETPKTKLLPGADRYGPDMA